MRLTNRGQDLTSGLQDTVTVHIAGDQYISQVLEIGLRLVYMRIDEGICLINVQPERLILFIELFEMNQHLIKWLMKIFRSNKMMVNAGCLCLLIFKQKVSYTRESRNNKYPVVKLIALAVIKYNIVQYLL